MIKKLRNRIAALILATVVGGTILVGMTPVTSLAKTIPPGGGGSTTTSSCNDTLLTFPAWFKGLTDANCEIESPNAAGGLSTFIWTIVLNLIETMLQLVGYISVGFIIRGGFKYMTSNGDPGEMAKAKKIIMDAIIGLVISILSVAIVNVIAGAIK